jgi:hypothetical protein
VRPAREQWRSSGISVKISLVFGQQVFELFSGKLEREEVR